MDAVKKPVAIDQQAIVRTLARTTPAAVLSQIIGDVPYMMPRECLPMMDCHNCQWMKFKSDEETAAGLHCYMFRDKPDGDRCGQMKSI